MPVARGQNCLMVEIEILKETLENMISSTGDKFNGLISSIKAQIFDIEHSPDISSEECRSLSAFYYDELERYIDEMYISRNKLVICIYSICEATLANICQHFNYKLAFEPTTEERDTQSTELNVDRSHSTFRKKPNYYLKDYLYTIDSAYKTNNEDAYIVSTAIRELRNYLIHSKPDQFQAQKIKEDLNDKGITSITQLNGQIIITEVESLNKILYHCYNMLVHAAQTAINKTKITNK